MGVMFVGFDLKSQALVGRGRGKCGGGRGGRVGGGWGNWEMGKLN